jgi:hypothetical protein
MLPSAFVPGVLRQIFEKFGSASCVSTNGLLSWSPYQVAPLSTALFDARRMLLMFSIPTG